MGLRLVVAPNATPGVECPACAQILQREKGRGVVMMMKSSSGGNSTLLIIIIIIASIIKVHD